MHVSPTMPSEGSCIVCTAYMLHVLLCLTGCSWHDAFLCTCRQHRRLPGCWAEVSWGCGHHPGVHAGCEDAEQQNRLVDKESSAGAYPDFSMVAMLGPKPAFHCRTQRSQLCVLTMVDTSASRYPSNRDGASLSSTDAQAASSSSDMLRC